MGLFLVALIPVSPVLIFPSQFDPPLSNSYPLFQVSSFCRTSCVPPSLPFLVSLALSLCGLKPRCTTVGLALSFSSFAQAPLSPPVFPNHRLLVACVAPVLKFPQLFLRAGNACSFVHFFSGSSLLRLLPPFLGIPPYNSSRPFSPAQVERGQLLFTQRSASSVLIGVVFFFLFPSSEESG